MHLETPLIEKIGTLDAFYEKLLGSGHKAGDIRLLFIEALLKFKFMVENSMKSPQDPSYKLLYLSNSYDYVNRGIKKFLRKYNWHNLDLNDTDRSWMNDVPKTCSKKPIFRGKSQKNMDMEPPPLVLSCLSQIHMEGHY